MYLSRYMLPALVVLCLTSASQAQPVPETIDVAAAQVRASTVQLREACSKMPLHRSPNADPTANPWQSEEQICDYLTDPDAVITTTAWFFGIIGAALMVVGMLTFAYLGGTMRRLWRTA